MSSGGVISSLFTVPLSPSDETDRMMLEPLSWTNQDIWSSYLLRFARMPTARSPDPVRRAVWYVHISTVNASNPSSESWSAASILLPPPVAPKSTAPLTAPSTAYVMPAPLEDAKPGADPEASLSVGADSPRCQTPAYPFDHTLFGSSGLTGRAQP